MTNHFNELTEAEAERLAFLAEECGEVIKAAMKILRHGYASHDPTNPEHLGNRHDLRVEMAHIQAAMRMLYAAGDVDEWDAQLLMNTKLKTAAKYLHHQEEMDV